VLVALDFTAERHRKEKENGISELDLNSLGLEVALEI